MRKCSRYLNCQPSFAVLLKLIMKLMGIVIVLNKFNINQSHYLIKQINIFVIVMMEEPNITESYQKLKNQVQMAFPNICETYKSKENGIQSIKPEQIIEHLKQPSTLDFMLDHSRQMMVKIEAASLNFQIAPMFEYGAMVVFYRNSDEQFTDLYLTFPTQWKLGIQPHQNESKMFPVHSSNYGYFYAGKIREESPLNGIKEKVMGQLRIVIKKRLSQQEEKDKKMKNHHTPSWLLEALLEVMLVIEKQLWLLDHALSTNFLSKGGTLDVGDHVGITQPEVIYGVTWSYLSMVFEDNELVNAAQLIFKMIVVNKFIKAIKINISLRVPEWVFSCLLELRGILQTAFSSQNKYLNFEYLARVLVEISIAMPKFRPENKYSFSQISEFRKSLSIPYLNTDSNLWEYSKLNLANLKLLATPHITFIKEAIFMYLDTMNQIQPKKWVRVAQDSLFTLGFNQLSKQTPFSEFNYPAAQIPLAFRILSKYCQIMQNEAKAILETKLKAQIYSHIELMKCLVSCIAFQIYKKLNKSTPYNVSDFKIPNDIPKLFQNFNSLSYKARKVVQALLKDHLKKKDQHLFFDFKQGYANYRLYANQVCRKMQSYQRIAAHKNKLLKDEKIQLKTSLKAFQEKTKTFESQIALKMKQSCECDNIRKTYSWRTCKRCEEIEQVKKNYNTHLQTSKQYITAKFPLSKTETLIHIFFQQIPAQLKNLLQIIFYSQYSEDSSNGNRLNRLPQYELSSFQKIRIYCNLPEKRYFYMKDLVSKDVDSYVQYANEKVFIKWAGKGYSQKDYKSLTQINQVSHDMWPQDKFLSFLQDPLLPPCSMREHQMYAQYCHKPLSLDYEQYIGLGSIRVGVYSQIPILLEKIGDRKLAIDCVYSKDQYSILAIWKSLASLIAQGNCFYDNKNIPESIGREIKNQISTFFNQYMNEWRTQDFHTLPVLGCLFSLLCRLEKYQHVQFLKPNFYLDPGHKYEQPSCPQMFEQILLKIMARYELIEEDNKEVGSADYLIYNQNCSNQIFLCFGGLCCFTESIINPYDQMPEYLLQLIIIIRFKKIFIQFQTEYYTALQRLSFFMQIAIENNISAILQHFKNKPQCLTQIIKTIDEGIDSKTKWKWTPVIGQYTFRGVSSQKCYDLDIYSGELLINDSIAHKVPNKIKEDEYYKTIFGMKNFEVYQSKNKDSFITRRNFCKLFDSNVSKDEKVLFEFGFSHDNEPCISMIIETHKKKSKSQLKRWKLIRDNHFFDQINIPPLYLENYFAWICQEQECIVFRLKQLEVMCEVCLVIFYQSQLVHRVMKISRQHYRSPMQELCDKKSDVFDDIVFLKEQQKNTEPFEILAKIQETKYILQLKGSNQKKFFWLHRFGLIFYIEGEDLVPEPFKNYKVAAQQPFYHPYVPWAAQNYPFIVLKKNTIDEQSLLAHQYKIIVPYHKFDLNERHGETSLTKLTYYSYDIHDNLKRIYGVNRESQLFLVGLLEYTHKGNTIDHINMTAQQYGILVLKSCFNNSPLSQREFSILKRIQQIGLGNRSFSAILMAHALFATTQQLLLLNKDIREKQKILNSYQNHLTDRKYLDLIGRLGDLYNLAMKDGRISKRVQIPEFICRILGLKFNSYQKYQNSQAISQWAKKFPLFKPQIYKTEELQTSADILEQAYKYKKKALQQKNKKLSTPHKKFPFDLSQFSQTAFTKDLKSELETSYQAFLLDQYSSSQIQINSHLQISKLTKIRQGMDSQRLKLQQIILKVSESEKIHIDIITGFRPRLSILDFVELLLHQDAIRIFYPQNPKQANQFLINALQLWFKLVVQINSFDRMIFYLKDQDPNGDKTTILRQIESPRQAIQQRIYWVCFQVEMKIQIWISQYQTFHHLFSGSKDQGLKNGCVLQLNMGEGKTQVIVPMVILQIIYGGLFSSTKTPIIPRINLLTSIFEESKNNYFRFLSMNGFCLPIIQLPFNRQVDITSHKTLNSILRILLYFHKQMVLLVDQSSLHSIILKLKEVSYKEKGNFLKNKQKCIFKRISCIDIHDQVDAQMVPTKSFIYSIGKSQPLQCLFYRAKISEILIEATLKCYKSLQEFLTVDENSKIIRDKIINGEYPKGLRFLSKVMREHQTEVKAVTQQINNIIADYLFEHKENYEELRFISTLTSKKVLKLKEYLLDESVNLDKALISYLTPKSLSIIYCLRGYLAHRIYIHCMALRYHIKYGIPDQERIKRTGKRVAVPYQASNVPSKRNDYSQPDVAVFLSYLSYYNEGISVQNFREGLEKLANMTKNNEEAKTQIYKEWYETLSDSQKRQLKIENAGEIKIDSTYQMNKLYKAYRFNCKFISFWLSNCVFPNDTVQYVESLTSSSWDHSDVQRSIGFSGTKDMYQLFPQYLTFEHSMNNRIKGTDGKMVSMVFENVLDIVEIEENKISLWQNVILTLLKLSTDLNIGCLIDVGALLAGSELKTEIVPWLGNKLGNITKKYKGISFCHENKWYVYNTRTFEVSSRGMIPDHQTLIIFDQYRTRGADFKMDKQIVGIVSLGPFVTKVNLMQGIGRLRKLGRNQKIILFITKQVKEVSGYKDSWSLQRKIQSILQWCCLNSIKQNEKYLPENSKLAKIHLENRVIAQNSPPITSQSDTTLSSLYAAPVQQQSVHTITKNLFKEMEAEINVEVVDELLSQTKKFGEDILMKTQNLEEIKEKESELQQQKEKQEQNQNKALNGLRQTDDFSSSQISLSDSQFIFNKKLTYSKNFRECTSVSHSYDTKNNQLQVCHFVYLRPSEFCMITIREANMFLVEGKIEFYSPKNKEVKKKYIARLCDLTIQSQYLIQNKLCPAYVQCKFYNGGRKFNQKEAAILKELLFSKSQNEEMFAYFLKKRRLNNLYPNSSLEKIFKEIQLNRFKCVLVIDGHE